MTAPAPPPEVSELALRLASRALRRDVDGSSPVRELWRCVSCFGLSMPPLRPLTCGRCGEREPRLEGTVHPPPPAHGPAQELLALAKDIEIFAELVAGKSDDLYADLARAIKGLLRPEVTLAPVNLPSLRRALEIAIKDATSGWRPLELSSRDADALLEVLGEVERWRAAGGATTAPDAAAQPDKEIADLERENKRLRSILIGAEERRKTDEATIQHWRAAASAATSDLAHERCAGCGQPRVPVPPAIEPADERTAPETPAARAAADGPPVKYVCMQPTCPRHIQPTTSSEPCGACGSARLPVAPRATPPVPENLAEAPPARYACLTKTCSLRDVERPNYGPCPRCGAVRIPVAP